MRLLEVDDLTEWRRNVHGVLVAVNGCFDLLHDGHKHFLKTAKSYGEILLVGLNSDESVRSLKGPTRPVQSEHDRAAALLQTPWVDFVCIFRTMRANQFLALAQPDCWCKSEEYRGRIAPEELLACDCSLVFIARIPNLSTTQRLASRVDLKS